MAKNSNLYATSQRIKIVFVFVSLLIVIASTLFTTRLANALAEEEQKKIEIWAEATRLLTITDIEDNSMLNIVLEIITGNTTIPVVITDKDSAILETRNVKIPDDDKKDAFFAKQIKKFSEKHPPIELQLIDEVMYVYYDDSLLLKQLYYFPYVQMAVILIFVVVTFFAFASTKRAEQNKVWVGLSKETAHQLGTPISSMLAWTELLKGKYPDDSLLDEMGKDVNRLGVIAERFSKIGSIPDLQLVNLNEVLTHATQYIINRTSKKVSIQCQFPEGEPLLVKLNVPLFEWVIENLCKNAIDAMNGEGSIDLNVEQKGDEVIIDVIDTGKGLDKSNYKAVFSPGYTTKKRGWGLGLSLAKRIIEEYHKGKIFVKQSEINVGTTFRIILKEG